MFLRDTLLQRYLTVTLFYNSGAQVVFRSLLQPLLAKQFIHANSASANLRAKADAAGKNL